MKKAFIFLVAAGISACSTAGTTISIPQQRGEPPVMVDEDNPAVTAYGYYGMNETTHRSELRSLTGVDPKRTEWCAAFVNAVLEESGIKSNKDHKYPLTARAFLDWGVPINKEDIQPGDVVVFPRGNQGWQGHVGFFLRKQIINGQEYWLILGGNQNNRVSVAPYRASKSLGIRRPESTQ